MKPVRQSMQSDNYDPTILTHPNIPKPLHGVNPRTIMGEEMWKEYSALLRKNVMYCQACGTSKFISGAFDCHEIYKINYTAGTSTFIRCVVICKDCHNFIHSGRLKSLLDEGKITEFEYWRIIKRGNAILKKHNIRKAMPSNNCAEWKDWKLIYQGKEYKPIYKNMKEWREHFNGT
jgi:hypothetical protein